MIGRPTKNREMELRAPVHEHACRCGFRWRCQLACAPSSLLRPACGQCLVRSAVVDDGR